MPSREDFQPLRLYLTSRKYDAPVDMLIPQFMSRRRVFELVPNLVQHMGYTSTCTGNGKERFVGMLPLGPSVSAADP